MKNYLLKTISLLIFIILLSSCDTPNNNEELNYQKLSNGFIEPPMSSRPGAYWCWLNGDVTKTSLTKDLEEMKAKGMGRAEIWDVSTVHNKDGMAGEGPRFLGDESVEMIKYALSEGKRLGIKLGMIASSGWNAGGSWVTPDWATKALYHSEIEIKGGRKIHKDLPFPKVSESCPKDKSGKPLWHKEVCVMAIPNDSNKKINSLDDIIILNNQFENETLIWDAPEGDWTVIRFVCSNTGQTLVIPSKASDGLFIDFLDPNATKKHLGYILNRLDITKENAKESGLSYLEFDSMELDHGTPWTDAMDSVFNFHNGYSVIPFLPAFAGWELPGGNEEFIYQFKKTVSDQLIYSHYTTGRNFLKEYNMDLVAEAGGPGPPIWNTCPVDALKALGNVSVPRGEFWIRHRNMFLIKEVASASHIYGLKPVDAESFTTWRRWKDSPHMLKYYVDRAFCEGLNTITIHTFANTRPEHGLPGRSYHAGSDINSTTTWWESAKPFMDYLSRCSYMLKQGKFIADVAYYYGDKAPNFFPEFHDVPVKPTLDGLSPEYDYDLINTDVVLNRMNVEGNRIVFPDGMSYGLLVLPNRKDIPAKVVRKVEKMIALGAKVLVQNPKIAEKIKGQVFIDMSIDDALKELSIIKDFNASTKKMDFIHRKIGNTDIYFVRNKTKQDISETCSFRIEKGEPEYWDPVTSQQYIISNPKHIGKTTQIKINLPAHGSCFIVFEDNVMDRKLPNYSPDINGKSIGIIDPWILKFPPNWGAPAQIKLEKLDSWTNNENNSIKYFSGTATYYNNFQVPKEYLASTNSIYLDLGEVLDVAEISINGKIVGALWTKPFVLNIREFVKEGKNDLQIKITNMWINRLTGDMQLPPNNRYCKTNQPDILKDKSKWEGGGEAYRLQDAGLIGPVKLIFRK